MTRRTDGRLALVTGGAGLIGSHLADLLLREGYSVRILDNLEPRPTGRVTAPDPSQAAFLNADIRDRAAVRPRWKTWTRFHHGRRRLPLISKYVHVHFGTHRCSDQPRRDRRKRSSYPPPRPSTAKARRVARNTVSSSRNPADEASRDRELLRLVLFVSTFDADRHARGCPDRRGDVYAITKSAMRLVLTGGADCVPPCAPLLLPYGPRQSISTPTQGSSRLREPY